MLTERDWARAARLMKMGKEFFYLGFYLDILGNWILKIGTTNDLTERMTQHNRDNLKLTNHPMMPGTKFHYLWFVPLSKYNSLRIEDQTKARFKEMGFGEYIRNDRFLFTEPPEQVEIIVKKTYTIPICAI